MQDELDVGDYSWEPAIHSRTHPCSSSGYSDPSYGGYDGQINGCSQDILENLTDIPFGQHVFEFILPCGYSDSTLEATSAGNFIFVRDWTGSDHPSSAGYDPWNPTYDYYGIGGFETKAYDAVFQARSPSGRYYASDVAELNNAFDNTYNNGGIFYAMFHSDRYQNSVIYSTDAPVDGVSGSSLMEHFKHVANRTDVWYVANGWMYSYHMVAERANVTQYTGDVEYLSMTVVNDDADTYAYYTKTGLESGKTYCYRVQASDIVGNDVEIPVSPGYRNFTVISGADTTLPEISDVSILMSSPVDTNPLYGWENIRCMVTDNVMVDSVWLNITYPDLHTENVSMTKIGDTYYYNTTLSDVGTYSFFIWANDTSNNVNTSSVDMFDVPPNWDITMDGVCNYMDITRISIEWLNTGSNGWIREDITNDGNVNYMDITQISLHWLESWP